jgi:diaminohydroxyphosphoribosylaminopyrimidine deaminase/5-amino-6-(5-phosphoribosylamino)uracil reductase
VSNHDIQELMLRAIALSENGLGRTAPNPIVGAVIVDASGKVVGEGFHNRTASPDHAEVVAIKGAGDSAQGASLIVTLEPCNHVGSTGACTDAIIAAGITKVIYAIKDPNPVATGGHKKLVDAGIEVVAAICEKEAEFSNRAWLSKIRNNRPYFLWKIAATLDGKVAASDGTSQWITNESSRSDVQVLRRQSDAILVGTNTVKVDNPHLIPRGEFPGYAANPLRVVCGVSELDSSSHIFDSVAETLHVKSKNLEELVSQLKARDLNQVFVEAGPTLGSAMVAAGLIDELVIYLAPSLLGSGKNFLGDLGLSTIKDAKKLELVHSQNFDGDIKLQYLMSEVG